MGRRSSGSWRQTAERLLERHLAASREWFPHELVPWQQAAGEPLGALPDGVRSALVVNVLTEDALPYFTTGLHARLGASGPWWDWTRRWTAEEMRHGLGHPRLPVGHPRRRPGGPGAAPHGLPLRGQCAHGAERAGRLRLPGPAGAGDTHRPCQHGPPAARRRRPAAPGQGGGRRAPPPPLLPRRGGRRAGGVAVGHGDGGRPAGAPLHDARSRAARRSATSRGPSPAPASTRRRSTWSTSSSRWCSARGAWPSSTASTARPSLPASGCWPSSSGSAASRPGSTALPPRRRPAAEHHAVVRDRAEAELDVGGHQVAPEPPHRLLTGDGRRLGFVRAQVAGPALHGAGEVGRRGFAAPRPRTTARSPSTTSERCGQIDSG